MTIRTDLNEVGIETRLAVGEFTSHLELGIVGATVVVTLTNDQANLVKGLIKDQRRAQ